MAPNVQRRWWRRCRLILRAVRIGLLLLVLVLVVLGTYLNEVGLPDFLKRPVLDELRARGVDLQFSRLRLRWYRGVVAENVKFGSTGENSTNPNLSLKEVQVQLNHAALARFQLNVEALILTDGRLVWPVPDTNGTPRELVASNIQAQLHFLTNDQWRLDHFTADFAGAALQLSGAVTNAKDLRDWKLFHPHPGGVSNAPGEFLRRFADIRDQLKFQAPPDLDIKFTGDARDVESFSGLMTLTAPGVETPWGSLTNGELMVRLIAPKGASNEPQADFKLHADGAAIALHSEGQVFRPGEVQNLFLQIHAVSGENLTNLLQARLEASADAFLTTWGRASNAHLKVEWTHAFTNWIPLSGMEELELTDVQMTRGRVGGLVLNARLNPPGPAPAPDESWAWWAALAPYSLDWDCRLKDIHAEDPRAGVFDLKEFACGGLWRAPELTVTNAHAELYRGKFDARATLDVVSRAAAFSGSADFDGQKISPLLTDNLRRLLEQYSWEEPPLAHASGTAILPAWTNTEPDWRADVLPTVLLNGDVKAGNAAFRDVPVTSAYLHFLYSNMVWTIPDLVAVRPEGKLELSSESDDRTQRFHYHIKSSLDPKATRHLLPPEVQKEFDTVILTQPPVVESDIWGRWHALEEIGLKGHVALTNFALRGESATRLESGFEYTNGYITLTDGRVEMGEKYMSASGLGIDISARRAYLTNGFSTMDQGPFFHVVGGKVAKVMEPYQFSEAPTVRASGTIPFAEDVEPDLHFQVDGGPFHWMRFNVDHISGNVDWVGKHLMITDARGDFYGGHMAANAAFDFAINPGATFSFNILVTDSDLHALMADVSSKTNRMEGRLNGQLKITSAYTEDFGTWSGSGLADLRDGLLWDVPVFGIFSPVLNTISPGLGDSRADRGSATFTITNSVIHSQDLEIHAPMLRMMYQGAVDFKGRVDATVEAKLFREIPLIGPVVSEMLTPLTMLFRYKVTGTLEQPKTEQKFLLTKIPMMLLNPLQTLKDMAPPANVTPTNTPSTNAGSVAPPPEAPKPPP